MRSVHLHGRPLPLVPLAVGEELGYVQHWIVGTGVHLVNVASEWPCWESASLVSSAFPAGEAGPVGGSPHSFLTPLEREWGMWNWGVGSPVSNWMSHLPVMEVKKVRKKQKCNNLALERTIVRFTLRDEAWFLMLCLYGFCNLLSTHYNSYVAKACTFPFLSEGVLAQVALSHFLSEAMHYFLCWD